MPLPLEAGRIDLPALLHALADLGINELQVEAGGQLCGALLQAGLVDEILLYLAPILLGEGGPGPFAIGMLESMQQRKQMEILESCQLESDLRLRLRPRIGQAESEQGDR